MLTSIGRFAGVIGVTALLWGNALPAASATLDPTAGSPPRVGLEVVRGPSHDVLEVKIACGSMPAVGETSWRVIGEGSSRSLDDPDVCEEPWTKSQARASGWTLTGSNQDRVALGRFELTAHLQEPHQFRYSVTFARETVAEGTFNAKTVVQPPYWIYQGDSSDFRTYCLAHNRPLHHNNIGVYCRHPGSKNDRIFDLE